MSSQEQLNAMILSIQGINNASQELLEQNQTNQKNKNFILPAAILKAFSAELGLKALLLMSKNQVKETHNLQNLFNMLDKTIRIKIKEETMVLYYNEATAIIDFYEQLNSIRNNFIGIRYFYENITTPKYTLTNFTFLKSFNCSVLSCMANYYNSMARKG